MNQFFLPHGDVQFEVPQKAYARFDQCEPLDLAESEEGLITFSAVSADWYAQQEKVRFNLDSEDLAPTKWRKYWSKLFEGPPSANDIKDPFQAMPFFQYEVFISFKDDDFLEIREFANNEDGWFVISRDLDSSLMASVYGNLFGEPQIVPISFAKVNQTKARVLSSTFDMDFWPDSTQADLESSLSISERADALVAFDIGQGSASALLDDCQMPIMYHDLGAGITRNKKTTPSRLEFCWSNSPVIVLSHWDMDHWAGALKDTNALDKTWIAPRQKLGPTHTAFANDILRAGGNLHIWPNKQSPLTIVNSNNQSITVGRCTGSGRNGTCLVMLVTDSTSTDLYWLLTGDGGYHQLPPSFNLSNMEPAAIIVPHHGAKMAGSASIPNRSHKNYARLLFSFGPGNSHGSNNLSHPAKITIDRHSNCQWDMGTWQPANIPGHSTAGGDVLATAEHSSLHLGGAIAGWDKAPRPALRPCRTKQCSTEIKQS